MTNPRTMMQMFEKVMTIEGRRLGYLAAARYIEDQLVAVDLDQAAKTLHSERLFGAAVPREVLHETARELRAKAAELEVEVKKMLAARFEATTGNEARQKDVRPARKRPPLYIADETMVAAVG